LFVNIFFKYGQDDSIILNRTYKKIVVMISINSVILFNLRAINSPLNLQNFFKKLGLRNCFNTISLKCKINIYKQSIQKRSGSWIYL